jgi:hypothetical protein
MEIALKDLRRVSEKYGPRTTVKHLTRALKQKKLRPDDLSMKDLAESLITSRDGRPVGRAWVRRLGPQKSGGLTLLESSSGVMLSNFNDITGQIFYSQLMEGYQNPAFVGDRITTKMKTNLSGEKIAGIAGITENVEEIHESMPYPEVGFGPDYIETPATTKRGLIISVTKETIFFDRTGQVLERANSVGEQLALRREKMILDLVLGVTNTFKWRGTSYNTYLTSGNWINSKTGLALSDWEDIDVIEQMFSNMLEPNTGEPIIINASQILHMPAKRHQFRQVTKATTLETLTDSGNARRFGPNTLNPYELIESVMAYRRLLANSVSEANAKDTWFMGEFKKAFGYAENWPITVVQAPNNSEPEFKQDIVLRWKASERGIPYVINPRYVVKVVNGT